MGKRWLFAAGGAIAAAVALAVACAARAPQAAAPSASPRFADEPIVDGVMAAHVAPGGPGAAVAVLRGGEISLAKGYGLADVAAGRAIDETTRFDLASVSKAFTAALVIRLAERGKMRLDADVRDVLPELAPSDPPVRVEDMLHMTSGLPEYTTALEDVADDPARATNADVLAYVAKLPRDFAAGEKYAYVNTNYALLAIAVERVAKKRFGALLREELLEPLGMTDTVLLDSAAVEIPNRATGYDRGKEARLDTPIAGDGSIFSTARDMAKWLRAWRDGKVVRGPFATTEAKTRDGEGTAYACGWEIGEIAGRRAISHSGAWTGTSTFVARLPDEDLAIVVLANDEGFEAEEVGTELAAKLVGQGR